MLYCQARRLSALAISCCSHVLNQKFCCFVVLFSIGINLNGSFVPEVRIVLWMTGAGMKINEPLNWMRSFLLRVAMLAPSLAVLQSESSANVGTKRWLPARAGFKPTRTYVACVLRPSMQSTLSSGLDLVLPKFLGLWRINILLFASAAKITVSVSLVIELRFSTFETPVSRMLLKAVIFLFLFMLVGWLLNHSIQLFCSSMLLESFWILLPYWIVGKLLDLSADQNKKSEAPIFILTCQKILKTWCTKYLLPPSCYLAPWPASTQTLLH
jgi:hypothetical protein